MAAGTPATSSVTCPQRFSDLGTCTRCRGQSFNRYQPSFLGGGGGGHVPVVVCARGAMRSLETRSRRWPSPSVRSRALGRRDGLFFRFPTMIFPYGARRLSARRMRTTSGGGNNRSKVETYNNNNMFSVRLLQSKYNDSTYRYTTCT